MRWLTLLCAALALFAIGCNNGGGSASGGSGAGGGDSLKIAVIPKGTTHVFWKSVEAGAKRAGEELGVEVIWKGPLKEDDREAQIKVVEDFITTQVDGIVLAPLDDTALVPYVKDAQSQGIPVVIFDSALKYDDIVSFVATDNYAAGRMAGEKMAELLGGSGKVIVLRYVEGSNSTAQREQGFIDAVKEAGIEILSDTQYGGATTEEAQTAAENLIARFKKGDTPDFTGVYAPNESSTFGLLRALQNSGLAGKVKFVGFDSSEPLVTAVESGEINALVVQNPEMMGYLAVKTLVAKLKGESFEAKVDTGAAIVDGENLKTEEIQKLLNPS